MPISKPSNSQPKSAAVRAIHLPRSPFIVEEFATEDTEFTEEENESKWYEVRIYDDLSHFMLNYECAFLIPIFRHIQDTDSL